VLFSSPLRPLPFGFLPLPRSAQLLAFNPEDRLGCGPGGAEAVKQHPWFQGVPWQAIANRQCEAPEALRQRMADVVDQRLRTLEEQRELLQQQQSYLDQVDDADAQGAPEPGERRCEREPVSLVRGLVELGLGLQVSLPWAKGCCWRASAGPSLPCSRGGTGLPRGTGQSWLQQR